MAPKIAIIFVSFPRLSGRYGLSRPGPGEAVESVCGVPLICLPWTVLDVWSYP